MEADLQRFCGVDWRDRWRSDETGRPRLTLRRLSVLVRHLPPESACKTLARDGGRAWDLTDVLLAHVWQAAARSKQPHPFLVEDLKRSRPAPNPGAFAAARRRRADRLRRIAAGELT